jgi:hypothetical protein
MLQRLALVRQTFPDAESVIREQPFKVREADITDILDAYAGLRTALREARRKHEVLGQENLDGIVARMII